MKDLDAKEKIMDATCSPLTQQTQKANKSDSFDAFLSYNSQDKLTVLELAKALESRRLRIWLDEQQLVPGRLWQEQLETIIQSTKVAAVLIGKSGLGPWEKPEMRACLNEFVTRKLPVIPVLLPNAPAKSDLPLFLQSFTWVDLRDGLTNQGLDNLVWGITGIKPEQFPRHVGNEEQVVDISAENTALKEPLTSTKKYQGLTVSRNILIAALIVTSTVLLFSDKIFLCFLVFLIGRVFVKWMMKTNRLGLAGFWGFFTGDQSQAIRLHL